MKIKRLSPFRVILSGFAGLILLGALILCLPISSAHGGFTSFGDALFTSTSAACVTGLVVRDTATYWSLFGKCVILALIQIGGLGVVTMTVGLTVFTGKKLGLSQRSTLAESTAAPSLGGLLSHTSFIFKATAVIELTGALLLMPAFIRDFGLTGIPMSFFHSVSAFCNAGFDLMGNYSSLTRYAGDPLVTVPVMLLIILGGLGFLTYKDVLKYRFRFKKYALQSKVALSATGILLLGGAVFFFFADFNGLAPGERILGSLFQSVTARTAGFNTVPQEMLTESGRVLMICLMLVGGCPGSTAGGLKTTTLALIFAGAFSVFTKRGSVKMFSRRVSEDTMRTAAALLALYLTLFLAGGCAISLIEGLPALTCLFESASAVGTVGISLGITPVLGGVSRAILIVLMFVGRVGGLTVFYAALGASGSSNDKYPLERLAVG